MADLTVGSAGAGDMTRDEERKASTLFAMCEKGQRFLLLEMYERRAHKCLRIGSFEEYCRSRLGLTHDKGYLSRLIAAARVERAVTGEKLYLLQLSEIKPPKISVRAANEIAKLPEDKWAQVYAEYCLRDKHGERSPSDLLTELKRIVKREGNVAEPASAQPVTPAEAPRPKPNLTPIVPPVYDGTAEQQAAEDDDYDDAHGRPDDEEEAFPEPLATEKSASANPLRLDVAPPASAPQTFICTTVEADPVLLIAVSLLQKFAALYLAPEHDATHELYREVKKFLKEYAP